MSVGSGSKEIAMAGSMMAAFAAVGLEVAMVQQQAKEARIEAQVQQALESVIEGQDMRPADTLACALFLAEKEWEHETDPDHEDLAFYSTLEELTATEANVLGRALAVWIATTDDFGNVKKIAGGR